MRLIESIQYNNDLQRAIKNIDLSMLKDKKVLVTGGLGLIGSTIVDVLICFGKVDIFVAARDYEQFKIRFGNLKRVNFIKYDALKDLDCSVIPDYLIHCAGIASPELYLKMPVETMLSNFHGVHSLLEFSRVNNVRRTIYISSSEIYGKSNLNSPFTEDIYGTINGDDIRSSYGIAKKASEMLCKSYSVEYGVETIVVRPGHIFGPSAKATDKRIVSEFTYKAAKGETIVLKSAGLQQRSYCYSVDSAIQILFALLKGKSGESYNISHDNITTIKKMAEICAKAGNVALIHKQPEGLEINSFNPMDNSALNNYKLKKLGYKDTFSVEEGLYHTINILKEILE